MDIVGRCRLGISVQDSKIHHLRDDGDTPHINLLILAHVHQVSY